MSRRSKQLCLLAMAMATIGCAYGWSSTAALLVTAAGWSPQATLRAFAALSLGIAGGVAAAGFLVTSAGHGRTAAIGLVLWAFGLIASSLTGFNASWEASVTTLEFMGGTGVGIAYMSLVSAFRAAFPHDPVKGGAIGPLGFAAGAILFVSAESLAHDVYDAVVTQIVLAAISISLALVVWTSFGAISPKPTSTSDQPEIHYGRMFRLWALLMLNVAPGMTFVAIAITWLTSQSGVTFTHASLVFALALPALPCGQLLCGRLATGFGMRPVFLAMFMTRTFAFAVASLLPSVASPLALLVLAFACHGGGFGMFPRLVARASSGDNARHLGIVLTGWGIGGTIGVLAVYPYDRLDPSGHGFAVLAICMAFGVLLTWGMTFEDEQEVAWI